MGVDELFTDLAKKLPKESTNKKNNSQRIKKQTNNAENQQA